MIVHPIKLAAHLRRRCRTMAGLLLLLLLLITVLLWRASIDFMDIRFRKASEQNTSQSIERFITLFDDRLGVLRNVAHLYESLPNLQESQFQSFCARIMADIPGIRVILLTDPLGRPTWAAPASALPMPVIYNITADPKLDLALKSSLSNHQTELTDAMDMPELLTGFLAASPIVAGNRHIGYVIGIFQYQELLNYLLPPDLQMRYMVSVTHNGRLIFPGVAGAKFRPFNTIPDPSDSLYGQTQYVQLGGQGWSIAMAPTASPAASPANVVSLTILGLGLSLSGLLTWLAYRWQWKAAIFQAQASDSLTRLERAGLSLAEIRTEMDLILNSVDEGIIFYDEQLEPVQANGAFLLAFSMSEDDEAMRNSHAHHERMIRLIGSETKYRSLFSALQSNPDQSYTDELELKPKGDGASAYRVMLRRATCAIRPDGTPRGMLVIYKDLTKFKMIDRVKDEFLASVTHELRSPLASIKGFAETIRRDPAMAEETRAEFMKIICEEAARLQNLIDELLDLRRMEAEGVTFSPAKYDIRTLVEETITATSSVMLSKKITVKVLWDGAHEGKMIGDIAQLGRALRNLMVNAVKYSPEQSEITIAGHCGQHRIWLEVADQGMGIDEKDLPHIFDKFYRGTRHGYQKGTGLGLAIVKNIIERHGGHLGVRSEVGVGTTFRVDLPRVYPRVEQAHAGKYNDEAQSS